jgi:hypothetical protein
MDHVAKLGQKILSNALNLRTTPALANLTERRHLLRVLQQFGEVLVFKSFVVSLSPLHVHLSTCELNPCSMTV